MAPNYGEESRDPKKNVPRSLYISVLGLGVFYTLTSLASLAGYGSSNAAIASAQGNAANFFFAPSTQYAGHRVTSVMSYLIITGSFACGMAFHNTTARYAYSLGREGMLPPILGKTHPKWQSPHIASVAATVLSLIIIGLFAIFVYYERFHKDENALVDDATGPGASAAHPGLCRLPAVQEHRLPWRRLWLRQAVRPHRRRGRRARHRPGLLLEEVQARDLREGRPPHQRGPVITAG